MVFVSILEVLESSTETTTVSSEARYVPSFVISKGTAEESRVLPSEAGVFLMPESVRQNVSRGLRHFDSRALRHIVSKWFGTFCTKPRLIS